MDTVYIKLTFYSTILHINNLKHFARHSSNEDTQLKLSPSEKVMKTIFLTSQIIYFLVLLITTLRMGGVLS